ncbi:UvrD-helicase domain-containing protein [Paenibacillus sp. MBLB4367]|uniref:UvrD-helicase domain-containing protein n=1 Tax=Paenibacillus sp. MBLB4367 TaxID=3384767 RepID=UPI0039080FE6
MKKQMTIYEARIDKARRMLFTLFRPIESDRMEIMIFHPAVAHDDVIHEAKSIFGVSEFERHVYEESPEIELDLTEEQKTWELQTPFFQRVDQLKAFELDDESILRFLARTEIASQEFWELKLRLNPYQRELVKLDMPLLIAGTAGSGKTTILLHRLVTEPHTPKLYITYSKKLRETAEHMFKSLVRGIDYEQEYLRNTAFLTFEDLIQSYELDRIKPRMNLERFSNEYHIYARGKNLEGQYPGSMVWEEIRGVIKGGAHLSDGHDILTYERYESLNEHQAIFEKRRRREVYSIFEWYQRNLAEEERVDELDLLRKCLRKHKTAYEIVMCDEVQDLSMLHVELLFLLANRRADRIVLAGDDHQIVHHSGFRWENVKDMLYKKLGKAVNGIEALTHNYRNSGSIAKLAGAINHIQREYTDYKYKTQNLESYIEGPEPILFENDTEDAMYKRLEALGPLDAVMVRDSGESRKLKQAFRKMDKLPPLVYSVEEAKGLEFHRVFLWKMIQEGSVVNEKWKKLLRGLNVKQQLKDVEQRFIRQEVSLLYVAVTRGMSGCCIYEGEKLPAFWNMPRLRESVKIAGVDSQEQAEEKPVVYTEADWFIRAKELVEKKLYPQALECLERVRSRPEAVHLQELCRAYLLKGENKLQEAAERFLSLGVQDEAIACYDACDMYDDIIKKIVKRNTNDLYKIYMLKKMDKEKQYGGSGAYCLQLGRYYEAAARLEKSPSRDHWKTAAVAYREAARRTDDEENRADWLKKALVLDRKYESTPKYKR